MASEKDLIEAVKAGDAGAASRILKENPASASARTPEGTSALLLAAYYRRPEIARAILETGMAPDLFEASAHGLEDRVAALLKSNPASVHAYSPDGFPPIGLAAFFGHPGIVRRLLDAGADPNAAARNPMKVAPVHAAAAAHHPGVMAMLLEAGADPNARQQKGFVPLHEAAAEGDRELARVLVEHGARLDAADEDGRTPEAIAREKGHAEMAAWLKERSRGS